MQGSSPRCVGLALSTLVLASAAIASTGSAVPGPSPSRPLGPGGPSAEAWAEDLDRLVREIRYRHPNPELFGPTWEQFTAEATALRSALPELPQWRIPWEFSRLVARLSDGHTWVDTIEFDATGSTLPMRFEHYEEGLFVIAAAKPHGALLGSRVTRIGRLTPAELLERAGELRLTSADNALSLRWWLNRQLAMPTALAMLGAIDAPGPVSVELELEPDGERREIVLTALARGKRRSGTWKRQSRIDGSSAPAGASDQEPLYSTESLPELGVLVWRYNGFSEDRAHPWEPFCRRAFERFDRDGLSRLVLDLRSNGGGNPDYGMALLQGIMRRPVLAEEGALVVLIGPGADSAAVSFCAVLERFASPVFVGRPTFLRPNGHADAFEVELPNSGLRVRVSTLYWRAGQPSDRRPWIAPDVPVPVRFADVLAGRDLALELAMDGPAPVEPEPFEPRLRVGHAGGDLLAALEQWRLAPRNRWADVEGQVNDLGYKLLKAGRLEDALAVFEVNCRLHPHASNVYESYGEALLEGGNLERSLAMYRESVRRDHGNVAAIERILELEDRLAAR